MAAVDAAQQPEDLHWLVQAAVELEHATIPPYLSAAFSLKPGSNEVARNVIVSVANEEMLHMAIASNLLNALGGSPEIDKPGFIPAYPGKLPLSVDSGLIIGLRKATRALIFGTFMRIEEPETPLELVARQPRAVATSERVPAGSFPTIGMFYSSLERPIRRLGNAAFEHPSNPQVVDNTWFPANELFPIQDVDSACRAIDVIVEQGEGTTQSPLEQPEGAPAHYYRFEQIVQGRLLEPDERAPGQFEFSGAPVALDPDNVWNLCPDPKIADYSLGSRAYNLVDRFNYAYTALLRALHRTFNGAPELLQMSLGLMFELNLLGEQVVSTPLGSDGLQAAPTFEYTHVPAA